MPESLCLRFVIFGVFFVVVNYCKLLCSYNYVKMRTSKCVIRRSSFKCLPLEAHVFERHSCVIEAVSVCY